MREDASRIRVGELLRQAYDRMPRRRFWVAVAGAITVALAIALPLGALVLFHEGPWTGFAWDLLVRLPFALLWIAFVLVAVREARTGRWKALSAFALVLLLFALVTGLAWLKLVRQAWGLVHLRQMPGDGVRAVAVACHETDDPRQIHQITADLRGAEWYSPDSHGWAPYAALTLRFADGHREQYQLTEELAQDRLVVRLAAGDAGLAAVPHLAVSLEQASLLQVADLPRYDKRGTYRAIVGRSVCK